MDEDQVNTEFEKTNKKHPNILRRYYDYTSQFINYKMGALFGAGAGSVNAVINSSYGIGEAFVAFGNQFAYNLLAGGFNMKVCEWIATKIPNRYLAIGSAIVVPTALAFGVTYSFHYFGGTEEPFLSSIWQVPFNAGTSAAFGTSFRVTEEVGQGLIVGPRVEKFAKYVNTLK